VNKLTFDKSVIRKNIINLKNKISNLTQLKLIFPVKTCTNCEILNIFYNEGFGFDVSNNNELNIVSQFQCFKSFVGPKCNEIETNDENFIIYYDNLSDYLQSDIADDKKGIRINFNSNNKFNFSHFGVDFHSLDKEFCKCIKNIHFHLGDYNSQKVLKFLLKEIDAILLNCTDLKSLDIGGGYEDFYADGLIKFLTDIHKKLKEDQNIILECGDLWFKDSGKLYAKIINMKEISKKMFIVYLSVSKDGNLKWSSPIYLNKSPFVQKNNFKYYFYGSSCYEKDLIGRAISNDVLKIGDVVEFVGISHYSVEWNTSFNGIDKIEVCYE